MSNLICAEEQGLRGQSANDPQGLFSSNMIVPALTSWKHMDSFHRGETCRSLDSSVPCQFSSVTNGLTAFVRWLAEVGILTKITFLFDLALLKGDAHWPS